jgi:hypothetical protein
LSGGVAAETSAILLGIGDDVIPASDSAALSSAISAHNGRARIPNVPDALNPGVIDEAKAAAFAAGLGGQSAETLHKLQGHALRIDNQDLGVRATDPTGADAFVGHFSLTVDDVQGRNVLAHSDVPVDASLAKSRAGEAQARLRAAEAEVKKAEAAHEGGASYGEKLRRRAALATAWRINARAWAKTSPKDREAANAVAAAEKAAQAYRRPSGGLI